MIASSRLYKYNMLVEIKPCSRKLKSGGTLSSYVVVYRGKILISCKNFSCAHFCVDFAALTILFGKLMCNAHTFQSLNKVYIKILHKVFTSARSAYAALEWLHCTWQRKWMLCSVVDNNIALRCFMECNSCATFLGEYAFHRHKNTEFLYCQVTSSSEKSRFKLTASVVEEISKRWANISRGEKWKKQCIVEKLGRN